ncbi:MAG: chaperone NapD [Vicinamibacterales bacterium]
MTPSPPDLHVAGLVVNAAPADVERVENLVSAQPGFVVCARDVSTGRMAVTLETGSVDEQEAGFAWLSALPGVRTVSLACHHIDS